MTPEITERRLTVIGSWDQVFTHDRFECTECGAEADKFTDMKDKCDCF